MRVPFDVDQFFDVFRRYNEGVWPAQWILLTLALAAVLLAIRMRDNARSINAILALLWLWMGSVYHAAYFSAVTRAAIVFAVAFVVQAAIFAWLAVRRGSPSYRIRWSPGGVAGALLVLYGVVGYPLLTRALGHIYPFAPTFGVPCPTTIFTFGLLAWAERGMPRRVFLVPAAWSLIGLSAAVNLSMPADFGLPVAAVVMGVLLVRGRARPSVDLPAGHRA